jgi:hypothetical protein
MEDYRLYYFEFAKLKKIQPNSLHKYKSMEDIEEGISNLSTHIAYRNRQLIIVKYTDTYKCKIIRIVNPEYPSMKEGCNDTKCAYYDKSCKDNCYAEHSGVNRSNIKDCQNN